MAECWSCDWKDIVAVFKFRQLNKHSFQYINHPFSIGRIELRAMYEITQGGGLGHFNPNFST